MAKTIPIYQVDAFTDKPFGGNPAAVCPLDDWLSDDLMQAIAAENNLSETAFFVEEEEGYRLRWFTPKMEVDLCGHATLASAFVVFDRIRPHASQVAFQSRSGTLHVSREKSGRLVMDFPAQPGEEVEVPAGFAEAHGGMKPAAFVRAVLNMAVFDHVQQIYDFVPNLDYIRDLKDGIGLIVTAQGREVDCVSRFFSPRHGIPEDPVTGSAHCTIVPYWSNRLGKNDIHARQVSERRGDLYCEMAGERVRIGGDACLVMEGTFRLP